MGGRRVRRSQDEHTHPPTGKPNPPRSHPATYIETNQRQVFKITSTQVTNITGVLYTYIYTNQTRLNPFRSTRKAKIVSSNGNTTDTQSSIKIHITSKRRHGTSRFHHTYGDLDSPHGGARDRKVSTTHLHNIICRQRAHVMYTLPIPYKTVLHTPRCEQAVQPLSVLGKISKLLNSDAAAPHHKRVQ